MNMLYYYLMKFVIIIFKDSSKFEQWVHLLIAAASQISTRPTSLSLLSLYVHYHFSASYLSMGILNK